MPVGVNVVAIKELELDFYAHSQLTNLLLQPEMTRLTKEHMQVCSLHFIYLWFTLKLSLFDSVLLYPFV